MPGDDAAGGSSRSNETESMEEEACEGNDNKGAAGRGDDEIAWRYRTGGKKGVCLGLCVCG